MDAIVKQALAKWPNVPHCYGWLALDARGVWRMRDERAQQHNRPGDKLVHAALIGFINRNYAQDREGRWYFQNGPQRVYVNLEACPYVAHTDPVAGFVLHTGEALTAIDAVWLSDSGQLLLQSGDKLAQLDDRDMAQCMTSLRMNGATVSDEDLMVWVAGDGHGQLARAPLTLTCDGKQHVVRRIGQALIPAQFGFVRLPQADPA
jgi:hypothetical protein